MEKKKLPSEGMHFHPGACHVCGAYGEDFTLTRCGNCKMIAYCSEQHQRLHWIDHMPLCRILTRKLREVGTLWPMGENIDEEDCLHQAKKELLSEVQSAFNIMGRPIANYEVEMIFRPRACESCDNPDITILTDCTDCPDASFCARHPKQDDEHWSKCKKSKRCFELNYESSTFGNIILPLEHAMEFPQTMSSIVTTWARHCSIKMMFDSDKIWAAILSHRLTKPFTFWFAIRKLLRRKLRQMTVHVVTTNIDAISNQYFWHYLLHYDRHLRELNIVFVNPGLESAIFEVPLCKNCISKKCKIDLQGVRSSYTDFAANEFFVKPNYVIGYDWQIAKYRQILFPTILTLSQLRCPLIVTSNAHRIPKINEQQIEYALQRKVVPSWTGRNPFASWRPGKNLCSGEFNYDNEYLTIYEKL